MTPIQRLSSWLRQSLRSSPRQRRLRAVFLRLEELEHRTTPSVTVVPQQFTTNQYTALSISQNQLLAGDTGSSTLAISNPTQPANATLVDNHNGTFTFTPNPGFTGSTTFQYTVTAQETVGDGFGSSVSVSGDTAIIGLFARARKSECGLCIRAFRKHLEPAGRTHRRRRHRRRRIRQCRVGQRQHCRHRGARYNRSRRRRERPTCSCVRAAPGASRPNSPSPAAIFSANTCRSAATPSSSGRRGRSGLRVRPFGQHLEPAGETHRRRCSGADLFGSSVSVSGDTAVIGALNGDSSQGAAYVFVRSGDTWTQQAELTARRTAPATTSSALPCR